MAPLKNISFRSLETDSERVMYYNLLCAMIPFNPIIVYMSMEYKVLGVVNEMVHCKRVVGDQSKTYKIHYSRIILKRTPSSEGLMLLRVNSASD